MPHEFELRDEVELDATPEQVWEAIATGPGIDSWFMGRNEVEPGEDGTIRTFFGAYTPASSVTAWEPGERLAYRNDEGEGGRFVAYEFMIEGRARGSTVLRLVTSGFLPGDDWEDEFEAMANGMKLFFHTLVEYLTYFRGRTATPVTAFGPMVADWPRAWAALRGALGLGDTVTEGDKVQVTPEGLPAIDGAVYFVNEHNLGVRTGDALYRFLRGFAGPMIAGHHLFSDGVDQRRAEEAWQAWLGRVLA